MPKGKTTAARRESAEIKQNTEATTTHPSTVFESPTARYSTKAYGQHHRQLAPAQPSRPQRRCWFKDSRHLPRPAHTVPATPNALIAVDDIRLGPYTTIEAAAIRSRRTVSSATVRSRCTLRSWIVDARLTAGRRCYRGRTRATLEHEILDKVKDVEGVVRVADVAAHAQRTTYTRTATSGT